ncbi:phosphatidylglycerol lysyltransferase domain-containing protein [Clavibacter zhangzhiyongii]|uniref:phosphatidylglycerol lysyltransferase domain-containing protein n=1 Tax=Clavibacter zhangzhiyongii TaxID=2768071 RepID=UPI0039E083CC
MRRRPDGINGVMEFLIARSAMRMKEDGIEFMSLSAAPLAQTRAAPPAPADAADGQQERQESAVERILEFLADSLEPVYGFRSLLEFKRKFQPELVPLIMAYPDATALPTVGLALTPRVPAVHVGARPDARPPLGALTRRAVGPPGRRPGCGSSGRRCTVVPCSPAASSLVAAARPDPALLVAESRHG